MSSCMRSVYLRVATFQLLSQCHPRISLWPHRSFFVAVPSISSQLLSFLGVCLVARSLRRWTNRICPSRVVQRPSVFRHELSHQSCCRYRCPRCHPKEYSGPISDFLCVVLTRIRLSTRVTPTQGLDFFFLRCVPDRSSFDGQFAVCSGPLFMSLSRYQQTLYKAKRAVTASMVGVWQLLFLHCFFDFGFELHTSCLPFDTRSTECMSSGPPISALP